jgi:recombinational DNA repair protein RecT
MDNGHGNNQIAVYTRKVSAMMADRRVQSEVSGALMGVMTPEEFKAHCLFAVQDRPELLAAGAQELLRAFTRCAQMGLPPGPLQMVALVPRKKWNPATRTESVSITVQPQWQGFKALMERNPNVEEVDPVLVHRIDRFSFDEQGLHHTYDPLHPDRVFRHPSDLGGAPPDLRGGYLVIRMRDGRIKRHLVSGNKIEKARAASEVPDLYRNGNPGPWRKWYEEMCLKSVIRDAWNRRAVPIDFRSPSAISHMKQADDAEQEQEAPLPAQAKVVEPKDIETSVTDDSFEFEPGELAVPLTEEPKAAETPAQDDVVATPTAETSSKVKRRPRRQAPTVQGQTIPQDQPDPMLVEETPQTPPVPKVHQSAERTKWIDDVEAAWSVGVISGGSILQYLRDIKSQLTVDRWKELPDAQLQALADSVLQMVGA